MPLAYLINILHSTLVYTLWYIILVLLINVYAEFIIHCHCTICQHACIRVYAIVTVAHDNQSPVWNLLFRIKLTSLTYLYGEWPISHCAANIWIPLLSHQSPRRFKRMKFLVHPVNKGLVPIHYKYKPLGMEHEHFHKPYKLHIE